MTEIKRDNCDELTDSYDMNEIVLSEQDSEWFLEQLAKPCSPNAKLRQALDSLDE